MINKKQSLLEEFEELENKLTVDTDEKTAREISKQKDIMLKK